MWDGHTGQFMSKSRSPFPILISKLAMHQSLLGLDLEGGGWKVGADLFFYFST